jgi:hypothetical protein
MLESHVFTHWSVKPDGTGLAIAKQHVEARGGGISFRLE